jgi:hypothetical protein
MADKRVRYVLEVDYEGQSAVLRAADDMRELDDSAKRSAEGLEQTSGGLGKVVTAAALVGGGMIVAQQAFDKFGDALRGTWDLIQQGAGLEDLKEDFEGLAQSVGMSGENLLAGIKDVSGGLITEAEAMGAASELINLNLGLTQTQIEDLVGLSAELGVSLDAVVSAVNTQNSRGLKELGLGIDDVQGRVQKLVDTGMALEEAFAVATIEAMKDKIEIVGTTSETAEGQIEKLNTQMAQLKDDAALAALALFEAAGGIEAMGNAANNVATFSEALKVIKEADAAGLDTSGIIWSIIDGDWERVNEQIRSLDAQLALNEATWGSWAFAAMNGIVKTGQFSTALGAADAAMIARNDRYKEAQLSMEAYGETSYTAALAQQELANVDLAAINEQIERQAAASSAAADAARAWAEYTAELTSRGGDYFTAFQDGEAVTWDFAEALYDAADAADAPLGALRDLATEFLGLPADVAAAAEAAAQTQVIMDSLAEAARNGIIPWEEYATAVQTAVDQLNSVGANEGVGARDMPDPADRGFRRNMDEMLEEYVKEPMTVPLEVELNNAAIDAAVAEARGVVDGFVSPEEAYEVMMGMDIKDVETKAGQVMDLLDGIPNQKDVVINLSLVGLEWLEELRALAELMN